MNEAKRLLSLTHRINEDLPPFFEEPGKEKKSSYGVDKAPDPSGKKSNKKSLGNAEDLVRGVSSLDPFTDALDEIPERDRIVIEFRDPRHMVEANRILSDDPDIGVPTYETGADAKSWIFYPWKTDDDGKKRIDAAVKLLVDRGIAVVRDKKNPLSRVVSG